MAGTKKPYVHEARLRGKAKTTKLPKQILSFDQISSFSFKNSKKKKTQKFQAKMNEHHHNNIQKG